MKTAKDRLAGALSRKLLVVIGGVIGIPLADLPSESWIVVTAYIVCQAVVDAVEAAFAKIDKEKENAL